MICIIHSIKTQLTERRRNINTSFGKSHRRGDMPQTCFPHEFNTFYRNQMKLNSGIAHRNIQFIISYASKITHNELAIYRDLRILSIRTIRPFHLVNRIHKWIQLQHLLWTIGISFPSPWEEVISPPISHKTTLNNV